MSVWDSAEGVVLDERYELGPCIGRGGSAVVHRAWDRLRGRAVAVKLLPGGAPLVATRPGHREADILAALDSPHLVQLHDVLVTDAGAALVMQLVDGPSLQERLADGPLPLAEAAIVLHDVAAGLAHAHRRGIVHRDVKPGNVLLLEQEGRVATALLSDFGIARLADATRTTAERTIVGTVRFLSPEQARGDRVTAAADVYSLGLTVLAAITAEDAFPGSDTESLAGRLLRAPAMPDSLPADWGTVLRGMTAMDPEDRLDATSVARLAEHLATGVPLAAAAVPARAALVDDETRPVALPVVGGRGPTVSPITPASITGPIPPRRRRPGGMGVAASVGAVGVALGVGLALLIAPLAPLSGNQAGLQVADPSATVAPVTTPTPSASAAPVPAQAQAVASGTAARISTASEQRSTGGATTSHESSGTSHASPKRDHAAPVHHAPKPKADHPKAHRPKAHHPKKPHHRKHAPKPHAPKHHAPRHDGPGHHAPKHGKHPKGH